MGRRRRGRTVARKTLIALRRGTASAWTSANPTLAAGEPGFETDTGKVKIGDGTTAWTSLAYLGGAVSSVFGRTGAVVAATNDYTEAQLSFSDITTNDVSTAKHGFVPKAPADTAKFLRGDGSWATIGGTGTALVASDPIWDAKGDIAAATGADAAAVVPVGANGTFLTAASGETAGVKWTPGIGMPELIYRYEVSGSDKASIDTGADTAQAGSNDWTGGDLLEVWFYNRGDEAVQVSTVDLFFNADTGTNYEIQRLRVANTTPSYTTPAARSGFLLLGPGANATASFFGTIALTIPNYAGTVGFKQMEARGAFTDTAAGADELYLWGGNWKSTAAITRLKFAPNTALKKFKVGTQLLIYKRRSA